MEPSPAPRVLPAEPDFLPIAPAERIELRGADDLSTAELLDLVAGARGSSFRSRGRATELLGRFGDLRGMALASVGELRAAGRLASGAARRLAAAFALGRRTEEAPLRRGLLLKTSGEIYAAYAPRLRGLKKERFLGVMLDAKNRVLREDRISEGILTASLVHPREVFGPALREGAAGMILVHNHPSGDPDPSPEDEEVTRRLSAVGELVGIQILDHIVVGDGCYVSFLERGALPGV